MRGEFRHADFQLVASATAAAGTSCAYFFIFSSARRLASRRRSPWRCSCQPRVPGVVTHCANFSAACCCAGTALEEGSCRHPSGCRRALLGIMATPNGKSAFYDVLVRLPVAVQTISRLPSRKSFGVPPVDRARGQILCLADRSRQNWAASTTAGPGRPRCRPTIVMAPLGVVSAQIR